MGTLTQARADAKRVRAEAARRVDALKDHIALVERKEASARRNGYNTVATHQQTLATLQQALTETETALAEAQAACAAAEEALETVRRARFQRRVTEAVDTFTAGWKFGELNLSVDWRDLDSGASSTWTLRVYQLDPMTGNVRMRQGRDYLGNDVEYPEERFGHSATVYGPRRTFRYALSEDDSDEWSGAEVNWPTLGSVDVAEADALIHLHQTAVDLAAWLNRVSAQWRAEDLAD